MVNYLLLPFFSQQNKETNQFSINKCCVSRIMDFYGRRLISHGHNVKVVLPLKTQCENHELFSDSRFQISRNFIPETNLLQRTSFDSRFTEIVIEDQDVIITNNEIQTSVIKHLAKKVNKGASTVIHFNHLMPTGENLWFRRRSIDSWNSADLVVVLNETLKKFIEQFAPNANIRVWKTVFPEFEVQEKERDIDILFVQRCSVSNYTHHREFIRSVEVLRSLGFKGKVVFTDPTHYLRSEDIDLLKYIDNVEFASANSREDYEDLLSRSKYSVALMKDDLHGGVAIRESIFAGCVPLLLDTPAYSELIGESAKRFHLLIKDIDPMWITNTVQQAIEQRLCENKELLWVLQNKIKEETFQSAFYRDVTPDLREYIHGMEFNKGD